MRTWKVNIEKISESLIEALVEAENYSSACDEALATAKNLPDLKMTHSYDIRKVVQIGEPWAYSSGWYLFTRDIVVVERSTGNLFTAWDVGILKSRLESLGFFVKDSWNGAGSDSVGFRVVQTGRRGKGHIPFSEEELAILLAPREPKA